MIENFPNEKQPLEILIKEYELAYKIRTETENRVVTILSISLGLIVTGIGFYLDKNSDISTLGYFLAPLILLIFAVIGTLSAFWGEAAFWNCRLISLKIREFTGFDDMVLVNPLTPISQFLSTKRGDFRFKLLYFIIVIGLLLLFFVITIVSFQNIYDRNHLLGSIFVVFYLFLSILFLISLNALVVALPKICGEYLQNKISENNNNFPIIESKNLIFRKIMASLLPRPWDFFSKGIFLILGYSSTTIIMGITKQLSIMNLFFRHDSNWTYISPPPWWAHLLYLCIYLFVEEFLLQQAKLLWDDIRDRKRDTYILHNKKRAIVSNLMTINQAILQLFLRFTLAFVIGYLIGGIDILCIFIAICFHQIIYVFFCKPNAGKFPVLNLLFLSFNIPLRFLVGVISVISFRNIPFSLLLFLISFYFHSLGSLSAQWKMEAQYQINRGCENFIRLQSNYFLKTGDFWQSFGLIIAIIISFINLLFFQNILFLKYINLNEHQFILLIISILYLNIIIKVLNSHFKKVLIVFKKVFNFFSLLLSLVFIILTVKYLNRLLLYYAFLFLHIYYFLIFKDMVYEKFALIGVGAWINNVLHVLFIFIFDAESNVTLKDILKL